MANNARINDMYTFGKISATDIGATRATSGYIDMSTAVDQICVLCGVSSDYADTAAIYTLSQSTSSAGAGEKDVASATLTLNAASETGAINIKTDQLDIENGFRYLKVDVSEAGNTASTDYAYAFVLAQSRYPRDNAMGVTETDTI